MDCPVTRTLAVILLLSGIGLLGQGAYIQLKAQLAQWLINDAWRQQLATGSWHKPWSWADTHPVAKLNLPGSNKPLLVLSGANGRNLAFGPTLQQSTSAPGEPGNVVIFGHNDTHFANLDQLERGQQLLLQDAQGNELRYRVSGLYVVNQYDTIWAQQSDESLLTLITCYPFSSASWGGELRYVVRASKV